MIKIYPLWEKKSLYPILAYWSFNNWYTSRNVPFKLVLNDYKRRALPDSLPCSFVACDDDLPVGMVSVKKSDMLGREGLTPWLSALYVAPEFREKGIGTELIRTVHNFCRHKRYSRIFLFIDIRYIKKLERYYKERGWIFLEEDLDSDGNLTKILFYEL